MLQYGHKSWSSTKNISTIIKFPISFLKLYCITCQNVGTNAFVGSNITARDISQFTFAAYGNNTEKTTGTGWIAIGT